jgi:hypothetical protein
MKFKFAVAFFLGLVAIYNLPLDGFIWNSLVFIGASSLTFTTLDFLIVFHYFLVLGYNKAKGKK